MDINLYASGNSEMVLGTLGMRIRATISETMMKAKIIMIAALLHMVVDKDMTPVVFSRKCPFVATSKGALDERPYCQTE